MESEGIIMMVFMGLFVVGLPIIFYLIERDNKRNEEEERKRKRK